MAASLQELSLLVPVSAQCPLPPCPQRRYATSEINNQILSGQASETVVGNSSRQASLMTDALASVSRTVIKNTDSQELSSNRYTRTAACAWTPYTHTSTHNECLKTETIILFSLSLRKTKYQATTLLKKRSTW